VHLRGLSKPIAPSVRIAALAARGPAGARIRSGRVAEDLFVSGLLQEVALEVLAAPALDRHLRRVRATLLDRRDALLAALATALPDWRPERVPTGGFHLWVALPASADADALARRAEAAGVVVTPGAAWFPAEPTGPYLRVSFAGAVADDLRAGVGRLAG
jgi:DNA-binding transcriptional MocR family regulator